MSESEPEPPAESSYRPKPPLWQPSPRPSSSRPFTVVGSATVVALALIILLGPWAERHFFSTEAAPVDVVVLRAHGGPARDELPADFIYTVRLPEGSEAVLTSRHVHHPADRAIVFRSRGRLTGRVVLTEPQRVLSPGQ
jgi:hypothetical protein